MGPIIYVTVCIILILIFVWICRYLDRKRRIEIYMRMLTYLNTAQRGAFCAMYQQIVGETIDTDNDVFKELLQESKKLDSCKIKEPIDEYMLWFDFYDVASRHIVLLNLINKLSKQWI